MQRMIIQSRYEVKKPLGEDSLSLNYKGLDRKLNKSVFIKILRENLGDKLDFILDRVEFLYSLNHKNIIKYYDGGIDHRIYYIVTEYVDGFTLNDFMVNHELKEPVIYSVQLCFNICQALLYAHKNYFFHGSLNPENILIANNGNIKLNNFGLISQGVDVFENYEPLSYHSPEQLRGEEVDFRTDIYSLGIILYELIAGHNPFSDRKSTPAISQILAKDPLPLHKHNPNIPGALENIIMKMIYKAPDKRFSSVNELISELSMVKDKKSGKILLAELFPDMDFKKYEDKQVKTRKFFNTVKIKTTIPDRATDSDKITGHDKLSLDDIELTSKDTRRLKFDFRVLDIMCHGTGIRYKEARDALILAGGDAVKAIDVIARQRKGEKIQTEEDIHTLSRVQSSENKQEGFFTNLSNGWSKLLDSILVLSKDKETLFHFPSSFLFLAAIIPFLLVYSAFTIPLIILIVIAVILFIYFDIQIELLDKETFEFKSRVELTLKHLEADGLHLQAGGAAPVTGTEPILSLAEADMSLRNLNSGTKTTVDKEQKTEETEEKVDARERVKRRRSREKEEAQPPEQEPVVEKQEQADPDKEKIDHICSRLEGVTPEEARQALEEAGGDQTNAIMKLKRKKRQSRKDSSPPEDSRPPAEPVREEKPAPEPAPAPAPASQPVNTQFEQEKVEYVCRRTKVSIEEAVKALEENNGDEIEAVMSIKKKKRRRG